MRLAIDKFEVLTDKKLEKPLKIILVSDMHAGNLPLMSGRTSFYATIRGLKRIKNVDFFAFCGDYVNNAPSWLGSKAKTNFEKFLSKVSKIAPVILVRGNHDIFEGDEETDKKYQELKNMDNVILLDNKQIDFLGIRLTGFMPRHEVYDLRKHGIGSQKIALEDFQKENFKFNEKDFNLILTHSPYTFSNNLMLEKAPELFEKCDVILSGHLHNGLMPTRNFESITKYFNHLKPRSRFKKFIAKNIDAGVWFGIKTGFLVSYCRGARLVGEKEIGYPILPSSKRYIKVDLTKNKNKLAQIVGKAIIKYSFLPVINGRPSVVELKISPKEKN